MVTCAGVVPVSCNRVGACKCVLLGTYAYMWTYVCYVCYRFSQYIIHQPPCTVYHRPSWCVLALHPNYERALSCLDQCPEADRSKVDSPLVNIKFIRTTTFEIIIVAPHHSRVSKQFTIVALTIHIHVHLK